MQYLSFCDQITSFLHNIFKVHVVACGRISFLFKAKQYSIVCMHHILCSSRHIWVASTFWLLSILLLWAWSANNSSRPCFEPQMHNKHNMHLISVYITEWNLTLPLTEKWDSGSASKESFDFCHLRIYCLYILILFTLSNFYKNSKHWYSFLK